MYTLVTNNPRVAQKYASQFALQPHCENMDHLKILIKARDLIHSGYQLVTHPISGSIKPNETPYKSILLKKSNSLHLDSLLTIENAIANFAKFVELSKTDSEALKDFELLDLTLFESSFGAHK